MNIGIIGTGNISDIYLTNFTGMFSDDVKVLGCADLDKEKARAASEKFNLPGRYEKVDDLLSDENIDLVINLTTPQGHFEICKRALEAGKHVYVEKPISLEREEAEALLNLAGETGLLIGGAPDTFLGAGLQTCRKLIDDGSIGKPVAATAFMTCHGHESWHPDPEFYYKKGAGPMFDMGPYYLTALVNLLGPVKSVCGMTTTGEQKRKITSEPKSGQMIDVEVPTHVTGLLRFKSGAVGTIITSFDIWDASLPRIEIYGTDGSLSVPDPNTFGGPVKLKKPGDEQWREIPLSHPHSENSRGLGVVDMVKAIEKGEAHQASGALATHVLDIMHGIHISSDEKREYNVKEMQYSVDILL